MELSQLSVREFGHPGAHFHSKYGHPAVKIGTPCKYEILPLLIMSVSVPM